MNMTELYQCTACKDPFVAGDEKAIARRHGRCIECEKIEVLKSFGLPPDFLVRWLIPGA
ncbi:MAG: hypothetical protein JO104_00810 [Candidatus Eremiobacteraeota bacterium]|nr:hypothetical protein [Candidatus Eremiobacteraeota bacterium]